MTPRRLILALVATLLALTANGATFGTVLQPLPGGVQASTIERAITQGGLFGICVILAVMLWWVIRRDEARDARAALREDKLTTALTHFATATERSAAAIDQNTEATKNFAAVVQGCKTNQQFAHMHLSRRGDG